MERGETDWDQNFSTLETSWQALNVGAQERTTKAVNLQHTSVGLKKHSRPILTHAAYIFFLRSACSRAQHGPCFHGVHTMPKIAITSTSYFGLSEAAPRATWRSQSGIERRHSPPSLPVHILLSAASARGDLPAAVPLSGLPATNV